MNKRGGAIYAGVVIGIIVFLAGVLFVEHLSNGIDSARISISCSSATTPITTTLSNGTIATTDMSDGNKLTCLMVDTVIPYFIVTLIAIAAGFISKWLI
jgi:hypothetical protein